MPYISQKLKLSSKINLAILTKSEDNVVKRYENLGAAVIGQAMKDYCTAVEYLQTHDNSDTKEFHKIQAEKRLCEKFFFSEYFTQISKLDGRTLLKKVDKELQRRYEQKKEI